MDGRRRTSEIGAPHPSVFTDRMQKALMCLSAQRVGHSHVVRDKTGALGPMVRAMPLVIHPCPPARPSSSRGYVAAEENVSVVVDAPARWLVMGADLTKNA